MFNFPHRIYKRISKYPEYKENLFHDIFNGSVLVIKTQCVSCEVRLDQLQASKKIQKSVGLQSKYEGRNRILSAYKKKKLVKFYILSIVLYVSKTWTLRKTNQTSLENFSVWCWRRVEKIIRRVHVKTENVLHGSFVYWNGHHIDS